jgi:hypothetical protein
VRFVRPPPPPAPPRPPPARPAAAPHPAPPGRPPRFAQRVVPKRFRAVPGRYTWVTLLAASSRCCFIMVPPAQRSASAVVHLLLLSCCVLGPAARARAEESPPWVPPDPRDCGQGITCFPCGGGGDGSRAGVAPVGAFDCANETLLHPNTCIHGRKEVIKSVGGVESAAECCAACASATECVAFTFWNEVECNLFRGGDLDLHDGNCTSGSASTWVPPPPLPPPPAPGPACAGCPNIVLMFTDDQDLLIGGWDPDEVGTMRQTQATIADAGLTMTQWVIHTPICAPSRSELLSGKYFHNIKNTAKSPPSRLCGSGAVGHIDLEEKVYPYVFAQHLRVEKGYRTGLFGKCMNGGCKDPKSMAGAFDRWFEGTNFYGGTWYDNESPDHSFHSSTYAGGYGTSVIGNKSIEFIRKVVASAEHRPFFVYFAPHAPHSPATPAKWYEDACVGVMAPRTPNWNYSTPAFHNLVSRQPPLDLADVNGIDKLARKRCQTLMSVDDSYVAIHGAVAELGLLNSTYFLVSSDRECRSHSCNLAMSDLQFWLRSVSCPPN